MLWGGGVGDMPVVMNRCFSSDMGYAFCTVRGSHNYYDYLGNYDA
jgi:hypothetical protein